jgi:imidazolonepropionase
VDAFVDEGFFSHLHGQKLAAEASRLGLRVKLHADEIALSGGTRLALDCRALSADHLLKIQDAEIQALAKSEVTATLLPTTAFFLKEGYAPAKKLLDAGARVALATDFNPGTAPSQDLALVALLAALEMKMTVEQILVALTLNGAYALGLESSKGALVPGFDGDFVLSRRRSARVTR